VQNKNLKGINVISLKNNVLCSHRKRTQSKSEIPRLYESTADLVPSNERTTWVNRRAPDPSPLHPLHSRGSQHWHREVWKPEASSAHLPAPLWEEPGRRPVAVLDWLHIPGWPCFCRAHSPWWSGHCPLPKVGLAEKWAGRAGSQQAPLALTLSPLCQRMRCCPSHWARDWSVEPDARDCTGLLFQHLPPPGRGVRRLPVLATLTPAGPYWARLLSRLRLGQPTSWTLKMILRRKIRLAHQSDWCQQSLKHHKADTHVTRHGANPKQRTDASVRNRGCGGSVHSLCDFRLQKAFLSFTGQELREESLM
jgi:hypothetical protein